MNTGIIASRYATALYKWVGADEAVSEKIYRQARVIANALSLDRLRKILKDSSLQRKDKISVIEAALHPEPIAEQLRRFLVLVDENGRMGQLQFILVAYLNIYRNEHGIHLAKVVSAYHPSKELMDKVSEMTRRAFGGTIVIEEETNPELLGGIVVEVDDYRYDGSVRTALRKIGDEFIEQNKRII